MTPDEKAREAAINAASDAERDNPGCGFDFVIDAAIDAYVSALSSRHGEETEWAPAFASDPATATPLATREIAQREVDGWNRARRRTLAREGRDIGESILVSRRKAGPWLPVPADREGES